MMRFRPSARLRLVPLVALALAACDGEDDLLPVCPISLATSTALMVQVTDSVTGAARADGATGWAVTGSLTIPLVPGPQDAAGLPALYAYGPPATYTVLVTRTGYAPWAASEVRVREGRCGMPQTVNLQARLQPIMLEGG